MNFFKLNFLNFQIEVNFRFGWRRDSGSPRCDDSTIQKRLEGYSNSGWRISANTYSVVSNGTSLSSPPTTIICTTYDITENWAYGYNSFELLVDTNEPFSIRFDIYSHLITSKCNCYSFSVIMGELGSVVYILEEEAGLFLLPLILLSDRIPV